MFVSKNASWLTKPMIPFFICSVLKHASGTEEPYLHAETWVSSVEGVLIEAVLTENQNETKMRPP